jgi:hypothetical protein
MVTLPERSLGSGAVWGGSCFAPSQLQQLLDLDVAGDDVVVFAAGPDVDVKEALEADDVTEAIEVGRFPSKTNLELVPVDMGLMRTGDRVLRKSR